MTFACQIKALLEPGRAIGPNFLDGDKFEITLPFDDRVLILESHKEVPDLYSFIITTGGFALEDEAFHYGHLIKKALLACGVRIRVGINVGKDKAGFDWGGREFSPFPLDVIGLTVSEESDLPDQFVSAWGSITQGFSVEEFQEEFVSIFGYVSALTDKQSLAIELYNLAHFEASLNGRFLTLVSSVECLTMQRKRSEEVIGYVDELIEYTKTKFQVGNLDSATHQKFVSWLNNLKDESIRQSCKLLVSNFLGEENAKLFDHHYEIRSSLLHDGSVPQGIDLRIELSELDSLVSRLIYAIITAN